MKSHVSFLALVGLLAGLGIPGQCQELLDRRVSPQVVGPGAPKAQASGTGLIERTANAATAPSLGYRLGPGDTLKIWVRDSDEIGGQGYRVSGSGSVRLPLVGRVPAAGLTTEEIEGRLVELLREYIYEPDVLVTVEAFGSRPVSMLGEVTSPGTIYLQGPTTLLEAVSAVGGLTTAASYQAVLSRDPSQGLIAPDEGEPTLVDGRQIVEIDMGELLAGRSARGNVLLAAKDIVTVQKAEIVYVLGAVNRAGGFVMSHDRPVSVLQAVAMAEGWQNTASPKNAYILRVTESMKRRELPIDLKEVMSGQEEDLQLRADDILFVPNSKGKQFARAFLTAAGGVASSVIVFRTGRSN